MDDVTEITKGIAAALHGQTGYVVYMDQHKQKPHFPCFYIELIDASQEQELGNRYWREYAFDLQLFMDETGELTDRASLRSLADALFMTLEYVTVSGNRKLRGTDMSYRITDNVLHLFVSYNLHVLKVPDDVPDMQTLTTEGRVKQDE